jgi:hypothetical protein
MNQSAQAVFLSYASPNVAAARKISVNTQTRLGHRASDDFDGHVK